MNAPFNRSYLMRQYLVVGSFTAFIAVLLGAFAGHILKASLSERSYEIFEIGVRYQLIHSLAMLLTGLTYTLYPHAWLRLASRCFIAGILLFSGSLYLVSLTQMKPIAMITPIGGLLLLSGWLFYGLGIVRSSSVIR